MITEETRIWVQKVKAYATDGLEELAYAAVGIASFPKLALHDLLLFLSFFAVCYSVNEMKKLFLEGEKSFHVKRAEICSLVNYVNNHPELKDKLLAYAAIKVCNELDKERGKWPDQNQERLGG